MELFVDIKGFEGIYQISNKGNKPHKGYFITGIKARNMI